MVVHRSRIKEKSLEGRCRRAQVSAVGDSFFQIMFSPKEMLIIKEKDAKFYEKPFMKGGVLCIYDNKRRDYIRKIYSLAGKIIYEREI